MGRKLNLVKHMSKQELEAKYKQEKNPRVKERLLAILTKERKSPNSPPLSKDPEPQ